MPNATHGSTQLAPLTETDEANRGIANWIDRSPALHAGRSSWPSAVVALNRMPEMFDLSHKARRGMAHVI